MIMVRREQQVGPTAPRTQRRGAAVSSNQHPLLPQAHTVRRGSTEAFRGGTRAGLWLVKDVVGGEASAWPQFPHCNGIVFKGGLQNPHQCGCVSVVSCAGPQLWCRGSHSSAGGAEDGAPRSEEF